MKEQEKKKTLKKQLMKQINNLQDKELKTIIIMPTELGKRVDEHSENSNRELENIKKNQSELKNTIAEMKNILEGINSRLGHTEECMRSGK